MKKSRKSGKLMRRLTTALVIIGAFATITYATGAHIAWRFLNPPVGAWWNLHEFWLMEGAATALGMVIGARIAARLAEDAPNQAPQMFALALAAALLLPLAMLSARAARPSWIGWSGRDLLISMTGYEQGLVLDNLLRAGVYFIKTAFLGILSGSALFGLAAVSKSFSERGDPASDAAKAQQ